MGTDKNSKAGRIIEIASSHSGSGIEQFLERRVMPREQLRKVAQLAKDALEELLDGAPNEKRMTRKLKEIVMIYLELDVERQVEDQIQAQAVKLLRENVIRRAEKERLAEGIAEMCIQRWRTLSEEEIEQVADDDDGALAVILDRTEIRISADDEELAAAVKLLGRVLAAPFVRALEGQTLDELIKGAIAVCSLAEAGKPAAEQLKQTSMLALESLGVIKLMRKSFAGLLLGDIILRQVGKSLGIKDKISVTDFIIHLACMIADKQALPDVDRAELRNLQKDLESI